MITAVNLNPTIDVVCPVISLNRGKVMRTPVIFSYPGGKGLNVARALSALGADTVAAGFAGSASAREMKSFLSRHGVKPDFIIAPGTNRTCLLITEKNGPETVINSESNLKLSPRHLSSFINKLKILSKKSSVFVFSGSLPLAAPGSFYSKCIKAVKNNSTVILDTSSKYLRRGIEARPHILKQNIRELESAFGVKLNPFIGTAFPAAAAEAAPAEAAHAVRNSFKKFIYGLSKKYGVKIIIVTLGEKGSVLFDNGEFLFLPPVRAKKTISPVGSGDSYSAGLAFGIERGMPLPEACRLGAACAAANMARLGACFFKKKELQTFIR